MGGMNRAEWDLGGKQNHVPVTAESYLLRSVEI